MSTFRSILDLLNPRERIKLAILALAMVFMGVMELVGIASVLPFMQLVSNPEAISESAVLSFLYDGLGFESADSFLVFGGVALLLLIAFANATSAFTVWLMQRFAWTQNHLLALRLFDRYLAQPYAFFLSQNTATLSRTLLEEVQQVVNGVVLPVLRLFARTVTTLLILGFLTYINPLLTIAVVVLFGGAYGSIYLYLRRKQRRLGKQRVAANAERFRIAGEALRGIKAVKVMGRESEFARRFAPASRTFSTTTATNQIVARLPRYALETIAFGGVLVTLLFYLGVEGNVEAVLPILSVYAFAAYRLMPGLNELFTSAVQIRFSAASLDELRNDLRLGQTAQIGKLDSAVRALDAAFQPVEFRKEVRLDELSFRYASAASEALKDLSLTIEKNSVVGFVGSTGSGKTTLVDILLGLLWPTEGRILVDGVELDQSSVRGWTANCGYVPQEIFLSDDTIRANIGFGLPEDAIDPDAVVGASRLAQLHEFVSSLPDGYDTIVGEAGVRLSGGQRQRIGIARALYSDPEVLVLDEATSALDGATERAVIDTIQALARRKTLIVIAHRLSTVERCDAIHVLEGGRVTSTGTYDELAADDPTFRSMAGLVEDDGPVGPRAS